MNDNIEFEEVSFDPMDVDFDDIDFETYEDPETGALSYDKPTPLTEHESEDVVEEDDVWNDPENYETVDVTNLFDQADDEAEMNFGDVRLKKREVAELASRKEEIEQEHAFVSELASNLRHSEKHLRAIKMKSVSEVDRHVAALSTELERSDLSDAERGARVRELNTWLAKKRDLDSDFTNAEAIIEGQKQEMVGLRVKQTDQAMRAKYGTEWERTASDVYSFAIGHGIPYESISEVLSPAFADILVMARKWSAFEQQKKAKVKDEIKATVARSKRVTAHTNSRVSESNNSSRKSQFFQKAAKGSLSRDDLYSSFDLIEDFS